MVFTIEIIDFLFGSAYIKTVDAFRVMAFLIPLYHIHLSYTVALASSGNAKILAIVLTFGLTIFGITSALLVPIHGHFGAAIALTVAECAIVSGLAIAFVIMMRRPNQSVTNFDQE